MLGVLVEVLFAPPLSLAASPGGPAATAGHGMILWGWMSAAGIVIFSMFGAIILLVRRLREKSRQLSEEKQRHFMTLEKAVRNEQQLREILEASNDFFVFHDLEGNLKSIHSKELAEAGFTEEQIRNLNIRDLVPEPFRAECGLYLQRIQKNGTDRGYMHIRTPDEQEMILEYNNSLVTDNLGRPTGVRGIARNITEQQNTRSELKKSEQKYRTILDSIEDAYYEVDLIGNIVFFNHSVLRMLGFEESELKGKNYRELVDDNDRKTIFQTFNYVYNTGNPVKAFDWRLIRKDKTICHVETSVSLHKDQYNEPIGFLGIIRDLTERKEGEKRRRELEAQLHQSQKLESIGTLAGGIAHDFNNILFPIIGYTEMTIEDLPKDSPLRDNLDKVLKAADRAKSMVRQILSFSRQSSGQFTEPVYIEPVVKETTKLLHNTFPSTIAINVNISEPQSRVSIDLSQLNQVLMNLCTNALHAMEDQASGSLDISVATCRLNANETPPDRNLMPGEYLRLRVSDTGKGIDPNHLEKIFEPYFSTKPQEKGTGLGLSVSYGIIKNAGGSITAGIAPGGGACFDVYLPIVDGDTTISKESADYFSPLPTGSERILLVEDEHRIAELEKQMIENLGYQVSPRTSSIEALEAFRYNPGRFDLVITDQTMPNMTGMELAKEILSIRPDIPVIICTGFSEKVTMDKIQSIGIKAILTKPIPKSDMALTIRSALDEAKDESLNKKSGETIQTLQ